MNPDKVSNFTTHLTEKKKKQRLIEGGLRFD
jgi:hypothetical protein